MRLPIQVFRRRCAAGALLACLAAPAAPARAEQPAPTADARAAAARAFKEGTRAFRAGDHARAATAFEEAYRAAPHAAPLWNAARAWHRAGELARAANGYARYLREAPPDAPDRDAAGAALAEIAPRLGRLDVHAPGAREVRVDDQPIEGDSVYVNPGSHVVSGEVGGGPVRRDEVVAAGEVRSVALVAAAPAPAAPGPRAPAPDAAPPATGRPLPPAVVFVGAGLTAVAAGLTVWSGLDTLAARETFDERPSQENLDAGRAAQLRTNVLLGVSIGLGALTGGAAIGLTDWGGGRRASGAARARAAIALGPAGITLGGRF